MIRDWLLPEAFERYPGDSLDLKELQMIARHPLQTYLNRRAGVYLKKKEHWQYREEELLTLSQKDHFLVRNELLRRPDEFMKVANKIGCQHRWPPGLYGAVAASRLEEEAAERKANLESMGISINSCFQIELRRDCDSPYRSKDDILFVPALNVSVGGKPLTLFGSLGLCSSQGLVVHQKKDLASLARLCPTYLLFLLLHQRGILKPFCKEGALLLTQSGHQLPELALNAEELLEQWSLQLLEVFEGAEEKDREVFHQLVDRLIEHQKKTGARGQQILQAFTNLERLAFDEDPASRLRQESNVNALPLITIHGSKGLEFEVVFALGVAARSPPTKELIRVAEELTLSKGEDDPLTQAVFAEADAEKLRQLYVALTRAKRKLYIPLVFSSEESKTPAAGTASPLELFLAKWCGDGSYEAIQALSLSKVSQRLEAIPECALNTCNGISPKPYKPSEAQAHHTSEAPNAFLSAEQLQIASFSSLSSASHKAPAVFKTENNLQELPSGKELGVLIHGILEEIPWGAWEWTTWSL